MQTRSHCPALRASLSSAHALKWALKHRENRVFACARGSRAYAAGAHGAAPAILAPARLGSRPRRGATPCSHRRPSGGERSAADRSSTTVGRRREHPAAVVAGPRPTATPCAGTSRSDQQSLQPSRATTSERLHGITLLACSVPLALIRRRASSVQRLIALAKARPEQLNYAFPLRWASPRPWSCPDP